MILKFPVTSFLSGVGDPRAFYITAGVPKRPLRPFTLDRAPLIPAPSTRGLVNK
nr:MAG TPA: hypothetical protein [Caudoviricetes sp.]